MGDLDPRWNEQAIADIWSQIGESPVSIKIMKDGREPGGGYCFVSFANANAVQTALTYNGSPIPNSSKHFKLNIASRGKNTATDIQRNSKPANDFSIFVGDLAMDVSEPILYEAFNSLFPDQVKQVKIMMDNSTRASKGFGFVRFFDANTQAKALTEANGMVVGSRAIRVGMAAGSNKPQPVTNIVHSDRLASPAIEEEVKLPKHARSPILRIILLSFMDCLVKSPKKNSHCICPRLGKSYIVHYRQISILATSNFTIGRMLKLQFFSCMVKSSTIVAFKYHGVMAMFLLPKLQS